MRHLVEENRLHVRDLVLPVFVNSGNNIQKKISSMPGVSQWSVDASLKFVESAYKKGIRTFILFGVVDEKDKDSKGSAAWSATGPVPRALELYKKHFPESLLMADACFCEYTDHGHCGETADTSTKALDWHRDIGATLKNIAKAALVYAEAGADIIAPSAAMDGMVGAIREALDASKFSDRAICSYAVKYASAFYGPFRDAAGSAPLPGTDRRNYQMQPSNRREALREALLDVNEGADMLLVKPGLPYLDILREVRNTVEIPVGAYQVSGEYAMIKAAAANGWLSEDAVFAESLLGLKRAGATFIISYWAERAAELIQEGRI